MFILAALSASSWWKFFYLDTILIVTIAITESGLGIAASEMSSSSTDPTDPPKIVVTNEANVKVKYHWHLNNFRPLEKDEKLTSPVFPENGWPAQFYIVFKH